MMVLIIISDCDETATRTEVFIVSRSLGFEKSFIYQTFHFRISVRIICSVPVVSPLKNIVEDQTKKCQSWAFRRLRFENPNTNK